MVRLTGRTLTLGQVARIAQGERVSLDRSALVRVRRTHALLLKEARSRIIYGVNTGFGPMADRLIEPHELEALQRNLIMSHACGAGEPVPQDEARAAMAVRLNTLLRGDSGVSVKLLSLLAALLNAGASPLIPERGGVGASGDLIQLSHIALLVIGEGDGYLKGERLPAAAIFKRLRLTAHTLGPKEGLALINGTSFMAGVAALALVEARHVIGGVVRGSALALEAARAFDDCLDPYLHAARPHAGQGTVAEALRRLTKGGALTSRREFERSVALSRTRLARAAQDPYSLRCAPQILGPALESLARAERVVEIELNSATDNPLVALGGRLLHGGNFHGEYVARAMDDLRASLAKVAMLSERRLNFFLHEKLNGIFPPFLNLSEPGLTLGLQALQFVATSTAALCQTLAYPHALHSIPSNADNQDVVSMGADSARLARAVAGHAALVCAIELIALSHAATCNPPESRAGKALVSKVRRIVPLMYEDRPLTAGTQKLAEAVRCGELGDDLSLG